MMANVTDCVFSLFTCVNKWDLPNPTLIILSVNLLSTVVLSDWSRICVMCRSCWSRGLVQCPNPAAVQADDVRASFLFIGDLNGHHQECLGSRTTDPHGVATFHFTTLSGCDQLVVCSTMHVVQHSAS